MRSAVAGTVCLLVVGVPGPARAATGGREPAQVLVLDGSPISTADAFRLLEGWAPEVRLARKARARMAETRAGALTALESGQRVYGWNQALGPLKDRPLTVEEQRAFQLKTLRSHAAGVGPAFPDDVVRLALVFKANQMARGTVGVRPEVPERLLSLVNAGVIPRMPQVGSLGTGDLQPQAAAGLAAIGEDVPVRFRGKEGSASRILPQAGLPRKFTLEAGEALPIISGSTVLAATLMDGAHQATSLADQAEGAFALFLEATRAEESSLDPRTHAERHIVEQTEVARRLRALVDGSGWMSEEGRKRLDPEHYHPRVQDAVSVRAAPHIMAGLRRALAEVTTTVSAESGSSTSNPLLFPRADGRGYEFVMGGNWDGSVMGHDADALNAEITDLGVLSHELSSRLLSPTWSYGLPANLAGGSPGLNSGMVQVQTVATALIPEMQTRSLPASVLSRPVKNGQEDHNTMAMASVRNLHDNLDRLETVLAVQLLTAAQAIDLIAPKMTGLPLGAGTRRLQEEIRRHIAPLTDDRYMAPDLEKATTLVHDHTLLPILRQVEHAHGQRLHPAA